MSLILDQRRQRSPFLSLDIDGATERLAETLDSAAIAR